MDSQMERNTSFVGLSNEDCTESMGSSNSNSQMDEQQGDIESGVKKPRGDNFTIEEDVLLVQSWVTISTDPVHGTEQSKKAYWTRIWEKYNECKGFETIRSRTSLVNRWGIIQKSVTKFVANLAQVELLNQSGSSHQDMV
jgi:hypothetical protein